MVKWPRHEAGHPCLLLRLSVHETVPSLPRTPSWHGSKLSTGITLFLLCFTQERSVKSVHSLVNTPKVMCVIAYQKLVNNGFRLSEKEHPQRNVVTEERVNYYQEATIAWLGDTGEQPAYTSI